MLPGDVVVLLDEHGKEATLKSSRLTWLTTILCLVLVNIQNSKKTLSNLMVLTNVLIPTAEVPLTNYYRGEILDGKELPIYFTAMSLHSVQKLVQPAVTHVV